VCCGNPDWVSEIYGDLLSTAGNRKEMVELSGSAIVHMHPAKQPELSRTVGKILGKPQAPFKGGSDLVCVAMGKHQSVPKSRLKLQLQRCSAPILTERCEGPLCPAAAFGGKRELDE